MSTLGIENIEHINGTSAMTVNTSGEVDMVRNNLGVFQVYSNADQNIATNVTTTVALNQKVFDVDGYFDTSTYRYTPQVAGYYYIECVLQYRPKGADHNVNLSTELRKNGNLYHSTGASPYLSPNGSAGPRGQMCMKVGAGKEVQTDISSLVYFNGSTDYVTLTGYIYNYTNSSATDNHLMGHSNLMLTYMLGYRVG